MNSGYVVTAERLARAVAEVVAAAGSAAGEAKRVADNLVEANLAGHDSHGVGMIPRYVDAIGEGGLAVNRHATVVADLGAMLVVEGHRGYGQVIGHEAMQMAIDRARAHGTCVMALRNSHHLGRIGQWAEQAVSVGLVSIHFVNVLSRPIVAPWAGGDARHGTNPFCVGVPRGNGEHILLDFATSRIAQGKARVAHNRRTPVAMGNVLDDAGNATTDPRYAVIEPFGALLPFGEHKGSGLALVCELLGGALTGGLTWHQPRDTRRNVVNGMLTILIDPTRLGTAANLARETEAFVDWVKSSPPVGGAERVRVAGDPERESRARRLAEGLPIDTNTWEEIVAAGAKVGIPRARLTELARPLAAPKAV